MSYSTKSQCNQPFGRRSGLHTITITKGDKSRKFTVRPAHLVATGSVMGMIMIGYLGATTYLVMRDDLIGASLVKQAELQQKYEARITALRARIDLITSQQLVEQQAVETKVKQLVERQSVLGSRSSLLGTVLKKAATVGLKPASVTIPAQRPAPDAVNLRSTKLLNNPANIDGQPNRNLQLGALSGTNTPFTASVLEQGNNEKFGSTYAVASLESQEIKIAAVESSLQNVESSQISALKELRTSAIGKARKIAGILKKIGVPVSFGTNENIGGPLVELGDPKEFETQITALDSALASLKIARKAVAKLPVGHPVAGQSTSSRFGRRIDPLANRAAMHSGIDYRAPRGFPVKATGDGRVVKAGRNGGYGLMVEVIHSNGLITRYAHMSRVLVKAGQRIKAGTLVGRVGSTGRSTGPHLHYEVRYRGKVQNPARYVRAGAKLKSLL